MTVVPRSNARPAHDRGVADQNELIRCFGLLEPAIDRTDSGIRNGITSMGDANGVPKD